MKLNSQQELAVTHKDGPVLVLAGAGSGKTRVIVNRIHSLITTMNVQPWQILAITFTNKAASEMRERIESMADISSESRATIGTFHSVCVRILRFEHEKLGLHANFTIADEPDQMTRIKNAMIECGYHPDKIKPKSAAALISKAKNRFESPASFKTKAGINPFSQAVADVYRVYEKNLRADQSLDFDDLIVKTVNLFRDEPSVLEKYQNKFRYILIDEYQDTNSAQYEFVRLLGQRYRNVMAVGDDDQSIYRWRGAEISNILNFPNDFPGAKVIKLEQNYRSTQTILSAASSLMTKNEQRNPKTLWTEHKGGELISCSILLTDRAEAEWIFDKIHYLVESGKRKHRDCAVLYRVNAQSRILEEVFHSRRLPYRVIGNISFFKRKEVKDLLSYIRLVLNPFDSGACRRIINVPRRGIGKTTLDNLGKIAREHEIDLFSAIEKAIDEKLFNDNKLIYIKSFQEMIRKLILFERTHSAVETIEYMLNMTGYKQCFLDDPSAEGKSSLEVIQEFENTVADFMARGEGNLAEFADYLSLYSDSEDDVSEANADCVQLMTLHNAKGLEFPVVFITGLEENLCPLIRKDEEFDAGNLEEERRLLYVGMTRAKEKLCLSAARTRYLYGRSVEQRPSQFLSEIPAEFCEKAQTQSTKPVSNQVVKLSVNNDYQIGERIRHPSWGSGTVLRCAGSGPNAKLSIRFDRVGLKKIVAGPANLIRLN